MKSYNCNKCGKRHSIYYGIEVQEPITLINIKEDERDTRVVNVDDNFFVDKKYMIINSRLTVETQDWTNQDFNWLLWIKIPASNFREAMPILKSGRIAKIEGVIDCEIPFYKQIRDLKANCYINPKVTESTIEIIEESEIYFDQQNPISFERAKILLNRIHHSGDEEGEKMFDQTFEIRLAEILNKAHSKLGTAESNFAINIDGCNKNLFQIINSKMLDLAEEYLTIYIPFDTSDIEEIDKIEDFKTSKFYLNFQETLLDGIPTFYQVFKSIEELKITVNNLIDDFYKLNKETIEVDIFQT